MDTIEFHAVVGQDQVIRPPAGVELPRGEVEVTVRARAGDVAAAPSRLSPAQLRALPRAERQAILAAAAALAEEDYNTDRVLTGFDAFAEEELDDDESSPG